LRVPAHKMERCRMNICFFNVKECTDGKPKSGVERVASVLAAQLRSRGYYVEFYPPPHSEALETRGRRAGEQFRQFLIEHKTQIAVWHMASCNIPFSLKNLPCALVSVWHNSPNYLNPRYADILVEKYKIRPDALRKIFLSRFFRFLIQRAYEFYRSRAFAYTFRNSEKFVLLSRTFFPLFSPAKKSPEKLAAIPNPMPFPRADVDFSKKKRELLFVGRMENGQKRVDLLLKIWAKLEARFPDWSLRLVGDGNDLPANKKLAETLGLRRAFFEGFQNPENYYREASIFCMTSAYEGFGMVLVESAAFGCVPVAFDSFAAVHDIISDGENGVLVPAFDLDAYAEKLAQLMSDNALRERLAQAALSQIPEKFSPQKIVAKWENLFAEISLKNGKNGVPVRENLIVSSAGKRVSLVREFQAELKKVFPNGKVFTTEMNPEMSPAARVSDGCFRVPRVTAPDYADELFKICVENGVRVVVPTIDTELLVLAREKKRFAEAGIFLMVSDEDFVALCRDKRNTGAFFEAHGIRVPVPIDKHAPTFPLFAKPFDGSLSKDLHIVRSREELTPEILNNPKLMFMEYIDKSVYAEFTVDMYFGRDHRVKAVVPRERVEIRAGEINKGFTRKNLLSTLLRERFAEIPGAVGCICAQFFLNEKTGDVVGIEINPRFGGGYPLSYGAGANFPKNIVREYFLGEEIEFSDAWTDGVLMLRYDDEICVPPKKNARERVVVFDLDDTLFKEIDFLRSAFREIAEKLAGTPDDAEKLFSEMLASRDRGENVFEKLSASFGVPVAELLARYRSHIPATLPLAPDAFGVLEKLRKAGCVLGVLTDGRSKTQRAKIHALGLDAFFAKENVIVSEEFGSEKPARANYEFFMKKFPNAEFFYVGDNPAKDFIAPNALGWTTVCLLDANGENVHAQDFFAVPANALPQKKIQMLSEFLAIIASSFSEKN